MTFSQRNIPAPQTRHVRKVCVVITARPSYSRIKTALRAIQRHPSLELQLVLGASVLLDRYGNVIRAIKQDSFDVAAEVFMLLEGETPLTSAKTTGLGIIEMATILNNLKPDVVVTIADRYETIATAVAASYMNIPLAHVQGGEVTGSIDEKVRHAVTKLSDIHLVATERAAERVIRMGEDPSMVFITSCPSIDVAASILPCPELPFDPIEKYGGVGATLDLSNGYIVVMQHPVTTEWDQARDQVTQTLRAVRDLELETIWFWPNSDAGSGGISKGLRAFREFEDAPHIRYFKNMSPEDFLQLLYHSRGVVGNSSVAIRECSYLGVPAVNIGSRQNSRDRGHNIIDTGYNYNEIVNAIRKQWVVGRYPSDTIYGNGQAGQEIADVLASVELRVEKRLTYT